MYLKRCPRRINMDEVTKEVSSHGRKFLEERLKLLNPYILPQMIWLVELYYLLLNSIYNLGLKLLPEVIPTLHIPKEITKYNTLILNYFDDWHNFSILLGVGFLLAGFIMWFVTHLPIVGDYRKIFSNATYGLHVFHWFLLIGITYKLYIILKLFFPLVPVICLILSQLIISLIDFVKFKFDELFGLKYKRVPEYITGTDPRTEKIWIKKVD
jgi:hypothetical protein